jgi:hypothetical protein
MSVIDIGLIVLIPLGFIIASLILQRKYNR